MPRLRRSRPSIAGYTRRKSGTGFTYSDKTNATVTGVERARVESLVIPPAWTDVWISPDELGHIQAMGTDAAGRRQYIYHSDWRARRDKTKFERALALAEVLPAARRVVTRELREDAASRQRALAAAFRLLDTASPRVGGKRYLESNGSHGLSTLLCSHVQVHEGNEIEIRFRGKGGQSWQATLHDDDLARVIRSLKRRGPNAHLLAWKDDGDWRVLDASEINDYVRERTRGSFTAKDFRTLRGTIVAAQSLRATGVTTKKSKQKTAVVQAMKDAAQALGNTPTIAKKSYVDPRVVDRYQAGHLLEVSGGPDAPAETALRRLILG